RALECGERESDCRNNNEECKDEVAKQHACNGASGRNDTHCPKPVRTFFFVHVAVCGPLKVHVACHRYSDNSTHKVPVYAKHPANRFIYRPLCWCSSQRVQ